MMRWLRKYQYHVFLFTMVVFLSGTFIGFGSYFFTKGTNDAVAEVDGEKIPVRLFSSHYQQALNQAKPGQTLSDDDRKRTKDEVLRDMIQSLVFAKEADRYNVQVPD